MSSSGASLRCSLLYCLCLTWLSWPTENFSTNKMHTVIIIYYYAWNLNSECRGQVLIILVCISFIFANFYNRQTRIKKKKKKRKVLQRVSDGMANRQGRQPSSAECVVVERTRGHHWRKSIRVSRERGRWNTIYTRDGRPTAHHHFIKSVPLACIYIYIWLAMGPSWHYSAMDEPWDHTVLSKKKLFCMKNGREESEDWLTVRCTNKLAREVDKIASVRWERPFSESRLIWRWYLGGTSSSIVPIAIRREDIEYRKKKRRREGAANTLLSAAHPCYDIMDN